MEKIDARKQTRMELHDRRKQVIRFHLEGMPVMQIVKCSGLSWYAVNTAIKLYKAGDEAVLEPRQRGSKPGTGRLLSEQQDAEMRNIIYTRRPWQRGVNAFLWNRKAVMQLIDSKYNIQLSVRGVGNYLKRWGLALKNPNKKHYNRCSSDIRKWLDDNYPEIEQRAQIENAKIHWASKTKITPSVKIQTDEAVKRRVNLFMISAVNNQGKISWMVTKGTFNQNKQIKFLEALIKESGKKKVFLIRDDLNFYRNGLVLDWIQQNGNKIELFPDPANSLNKEV